MRDGEIKKKGDHILYEESNSHSTGNIFVSEMVIAAMHSDEIFGSSFIKVCKIRK